MLSTYNKRLEPGAITRLRPLPPSYFCTCHSQTMPCSPARLTTTVILCAATLLLSACLVRTRVVGPPGKVANRPLLTAHKEELIDRIHQMSDRIQSFTMKTDMAASVGSLYSGAVKDYATIAGVLLYRRPDSIRIIGQDPVVHSTLFDMASIGNEFRLSIPSKSRFVEGANDAPAKSANKLENLRPVAFLSALLIEPPDAKTDVTLMEDDTDETKAVYILFIIRRRGDQLRLLRNVYFDRYTLQIVRQKTFDPSGAILSESKYSGWKPYGGLSFPTVVDIKRPQDNYEVTLTISDVKFNTGDVTPEKFVLVQPPGYQLQQIKELP